MDAMMNGLDAGKDGMYVSEASTALLSIDKSLAVSCKVVQDAGGASKTQAVMQSAAGSALVHHFVKHSADVAEEVCKCIANARTRDAAVSGVIPVLVETGLKWSQVDDSRSTNPLNGFVVGLLHKGTDSLSVLIALVAVAESLPETQTTISTEVVQTCLSHFPNLIQQYCGAKKDGPPSKIQIAAGQVLLCWLCVCEREDLWQHVSMLERMVETVKVWFAKGKPMLVPSCDAVLAAFNFASEAKRAYGAFTHNAARVGCASDATKPPPPLLPLLMFSTVLANVAPFQQPKKFQLLYRSLGAEVSQDQGIETSFQKFLTQRDPRKGVEEHCASFVTALAEYPASSTAGARIFVTYGVLASLPKAAWDTFLSVPAHSQCIVDSVCSACLRFLTEKHQKPAEAKPMRAMVSEMLGFVLKRLRKVGQGQTAPLSASEVARYVRECGIPALAIAMDVVQTHGNSYAASCVKELLMIPAGAEESVVQTCIEAAKSIAALSSENSSMALDLLSCVDSHLERSDLPYGLLQEVAEMLANSVDFHILAPVLLERAVRLPDESDARVAILSHCDVTQKPSQSFEAQFKSLKTKCKKMASKGAPPSDASQAALFSVAVLQLCALTYAAKGFTPLTEEDAQNLACTNGANDAALVFPATITSLLLAHTQSHGLAYTKDEDNVKDPLTLHSGVAAAATPGDISVFMNPGGSNDHAADNAFLLKVGKYLTALWGGCVTCWGGQDGCTLFATHKGAPRGGCATRVELLYSVLLAAPSEETVVGPCCSAVSAGASCADVDVDLFVAPLVTLLSAGSSDMFQQLAPLLLLRALPPKAFGNAIRESLFASMQTEVSGSADLYSDLLPRVFPGCYSEEDEAFGEVTRYVDGKLSGVQPNQMSQNLKVVLVLLCRGAMCVMSSAVPRQCATTPSGLLRILLEKVICSVLGVSTECTTVEASLRKCHQRLGAALLDAVSLVCAAEVRDGGIDTFVARLLQTGERGVFDQLVTTTSLVGTIAYLSKPEMGQGGVPNALCRAFLSFGVASGTRSAEFIFNVVYHWTGDFSGVVPQLLPLFTQCVAAEYPANLSALKLAGVMFAKAPEGEMTEPCLAQILEAISPLCDARRFPADVVQLASQLMGLLMGSN